MNTLSPAAAIREAPESSFVHVNRLPGSPAAARKAASRAAADGVLLPIRRGLYYRGHPTRYGLTPPRAEDIAREVLGTRGVGPAGYSAARSWAVTTQVPSSWHVATIRLADPITGVVQHSRSNLDRIGLSELEIALLELLREPGVFIENGWDSFVKKVGTASDTGKIRMHEIGLAVPNEYHLAVRSNFERLNHDLELAA